MRETSLDVLQMPTEVGSEAASRPKSPGVPGFTVLAHPDVRRVGEVALFPDLRAGQSVELSRKSPRFGPIRGGKPFPLATAKLSRAPILLRGIPRGGLVLDLAGSSIPLEVNGEPVRDERKVSAAEIEQGVVLLLASRVVLLLHLLQEETPRPLPRDWVGESAALHYAYQQIRDVASRSATVLLRGETGTGKELAAQELHRLSGRPGRLVVTSLAELGGELAQAELFGTCVGAFTDARRRDGLVLAADKGTLFLDEVALARPEVQAILLRVLEERTVRAVGAERDRPVDVRIVVGTDGDLESMQRLGTFLPSLYFRLSECEITLPPLRERREDLGRLLRIFMHQADRSSDRVDQERAAMLEVPARWVAEWALYSWPGNVRELANLANRLVITNLGLRRAERRPSLRDERPGVVSGQNRTVAEDESGEDGKEPGDLGDARSVPPADILIALEKHRWSPTKVSRELRVRRSSLYRVKTDLFTLKAEDLPVERVRAVLEETGGDLDRMVSTLRTGRRSLELLLGRLGLR